MKIDLDQKLLISLSHRPSLGLSKGKMGICLYFYYLGRLNSSKEYFQTASNLLDDIFKEIGNVKTIDVELGLTGIGLGINYLIKENYVKGNINTILSDIDNEILKEILYEKYYKEADFAKTIPIIYYLYERLLRQKKDSFDEELFQEAIIYSLNNIYSEITPTLLHDDPFTYDSLQYSLPQFLFILSKLCSLSFYNNRIIKIIEEITPYILSFIPTIHTNRLYLLWGVGSILEYYKTKSWENYFNLLKREISFNEILTNELTDLKIYFADGLTGLYCLLRTQHKHFTNKDIVLANKDIFNRINLSQCWELLHSDKDYFDRHRGLAYGYCGVSILQHLSKKV